MGLFHSSFNMVSGHELMPEYVPGLDAGLLAVAVVAVLAVVIAASTRGRLGYEPERGAATARRIHRAARLRVTRG